MLTDLRALLPRSTPLVSTSSDPKNMAELSHTLNFRPLAPDQSPQVTHGVEFPPSPEHSDASILITSPPYGRDGEPQKEGPQEPDKQSMRTRENPFDI